MSTYDFLTVIDTGPDSGGSGMPFPIETDTPTDTSYYPLTMPLGVNPDAPANNPDILVPSVARWGWRARKWTLTTDATASDGTFSVSFPGGELIDVSGRTDEEEIVLVGYGTQLHSVSGFGYSFSFELFGDPTPSCWFDDPDYRPQIDLVGELTSTDGGGNAATLELSTRTANLSGAPTGSFTGTIDGVNVTIYYYITTSGAGSASISTFTLDPTTFWGWDSKYDTSTGDYL